MARAILGLGTNQGDRLESLRKAVTKLGLGVRKVSQVYESAAMLPDQAPDAWNQPFLNLCVEYETELGPGELLARVKRLELELGRDATEARRWAPRLIDIDILALGEQAHEDAQLRVPHAGLADRPFALLPFAELWPQWRHPVLNRSAQELASKWHSENGAGVPYGTLRVSMLLTRFVGILNITPDSFSDGGMHALDPRWARGRFEELVAQGAEIVDVGAESTRPGAKPTEFEQEWARLEPALSAIAQSPLRKKALLSIDTRHGEVARRALQLGADWLNDVSAFESEAMQKAALESEARLIFMHNLGVPADRAKVLGSEVDPVETILEWAEQRLVALERLGISRNRLIFDPGIGFGKSPSQNHALIAEISRFRLLGVPLFVGHSRKSFEPARDTVEVSRQLARAGVEFLRVHEVAASRTACLSGAQLN